jgi:hypothetical protein
VKNQNDMIVSIVAIVVALIALGVLYGTKPDPKAAKAAPQVKTAAPTLGEVQVPMVNGVGGGGSTNTRSAAFGSGGGNGGFNPAGGGSPQAGGAAPTGGMRMATGGATQTP